MSLNKLRKNNFYLQIRGVLAQFKLNVKHCGRYCSPNFIIFIYFIYNN